MRTPGNHVKGTRRGCNVGRSREQLRAVRGSPKGRFTGPALPVTLLGIGDLEEGISEPLVLAVAVAAVGGFLLVCLCF